MSMPATNDQITSRLAAVPMFSDLSEGNLETLAGMVRFMRLPKGALIVSKDDPGSCMYLLLSGRVKVGITSPDGKELVLNYLEAPAHFGEMSLVEAESRTADVVATTDVELIALEGRDLAEAIRIEPNLALSLIATLSRRLRATITRLEDMAFHDATHRVLRVVLNVATANLEARGAAVVQGMTHYDIATLAGTSRETASRVISQLARDGVVTTHGRRIIVDVSALSDRLTAE